MDQQSFKLSLAASHHIESFNYIVKTGINKVLSHLDPMELNQTDINHENLTQKNLPVPFNTIKIHFSQLKLGQPYKFNDPTAIHQEILPQ